MIQLSIVGLITFFFFSSVALRVLGIKISNLEACGSRTGTRFTSEACCHQSGKGTFRGLFVFSCYCFVSKVDHLSP